MSNTNPPPATPEETGFISSLARAVRESEGSPLRAVGGIGGAIGKQVLKGLEKLIIPYRELVSRPLSTAFLASNTDYRDDIDGGFFDVDTWKTAYNNSRTVSPGQSIVGFVGGTLVAGDQGTDKIDWANQTEVKDYFSRGPQKYISFASDFATSFFLDPLVLTGRGTGVVRRAIVTRPVTTKRMPALLKDIDDGVAGVDNSVRKMIDFFKANSENLSVIRADPMISGSQMGEAVAEIMQEAARLAIRSGDDSFIGNLLKIGIGNEPARDALRLQSETLINRIDTLQGRKLDVDKYLRGNRKQKIQDANSTEYMLPYGIEMMARQRIPKLKEQEILGKELAEATKQSDFISKLLSSDDSVQGIFKDITWSPYAALEATRIKNNLKFNGAFWGIIDNGKGTRVLRWFNPTQALREKSSGIARIAGVVGDRSIIEGRARVRQYGEKTGASGKEQQDLFNTFPGRGNKTQKGRWFDDLQEKTVAGILKKHVGATDPDEIKLIEELGIMFARKSNDFKRQTLIRIIDEPEYTINDSFGNKATLELMKDYVDELAKEISAKRGKIKIDEDDIKSARETAKNLMSDVPTMESQVPTLHIAMDMDIFDDVIREQAEVFKILLDDIRNNPLEYNGKSPAFILGEILDRRIGQLTNSETSVDAASRVALRGRNIAEQLTDNLYSLVWKPTTLMSFKYTSRNVTEGWMRAFASGIELARDSDLTLREVLSGGYEKGVITRFKLRKNQEAHARAASIIFNAEYPKLTKEGKKLYKKIDDLLGASTDSLSSNIVEIVENSKLTASNYGRMSDVVSNEAIRKAMREMADAPYRLADDIPPLTAKDIKDPEILERVNKIRQELYDSILEGDIRNARNLITASDEGPVFDVLRIMQERLRKQHDTIDAIKLGEDYADIPPKLQEYIESTLNAYKGMDESLQNVAHTALTRAGVRGRMDKLINDGTVNRKVIAAGTEEFEAIPGLKLAGYRSGPIGQIMSKEISAGQNNMRTIFDSQRISESRFVNGQIHERTITPDNKIWALAAADFANHHMNDAVAQMFIKDMKLADAVKWAKSNDPKAVKWRAVKTYDLERYRASGVTDSIARIVKEIELTVDNILPKIGIDGQVIDGIADATGKPIPSLRVKGMRGELTAEDMLKIPESQRASVRGNELSDAGPNKIMNSWKGFVGKIFDVIGTKPEDALIRHPFYNMMYKAEGKRRAKLLQDQGYSIEQIQKMSAEIQTQSHRFAYKMLMERLYSIERHTDPGHLLRFISPFYMAKQDSNRYWFGYTLRNPSAAARYFMIYNSPARVFSVEDENGREIKTVNPFDAQDATLKITVPGAVARFFGKDIPEGVSLNTPISSFDLINNGYLPFIPELGGPLVDVGAGTILNSLSGKAYDPELLLTKMGVDPEFLRDKLFPYYKSQQDLSSAEVLLSIAISPNSWMRSLAASEIPIISNVLGVIDPRASDRYMRRVIVAYNEIFAKWDSDRDPYNPEALTDEKRAEMLAQALGAATQMNFAEAIFSAFGYVVAPRFATQQEEMRKDLRIMKQDAVNNGLTEDYGLLEFINQHGFERASVAQFTPREQNPFGFMSTPQTLNNLNKYSDPFSDAFREVGESKVAGAMLNAGDPVKDYSAVSNSKLYSSKVTGIGAVKNKLTDPNEAARELEVSQGVKMQFAAKDYFDAQVESGEISDKDAKQKYKDAKAVIAQRYPAWLAESGTFDTQKANNNVKVIFKFLGNEKYINGFVKNNEDVQKAVYFYMVARKNLVSARMRIDSNPNANIDSDKFADVQFMQKQIVNDLTKQVPEFGKFFQYYLENDPLSFDAEIVSID